MYDQIREDTLYIMLYAGVTVMAMIACCYLLFRQGNAIAADITPPARLRRWTSAFFAVFVLNHLWYMWPMFFLTSSDDVLLANLIGGVLDCTTFFPVAIIVLLVMLQDRRRPLWPVAVMVAPLVAGMIWCIATRSQALIPVLLVYLLLMSIGLMIYMIRALRQYGRWLRDNYADLEHKEVWQSFVVLGIMLSAFGVYASCSRGPAYEYVLQLIVALLICYLLWRVDTLSELSITADQDDSLMSAQELELADSPFEPDGDQVPSTDVNDNNLSQAIQVKIGALLQQHCVATQLYLQHDLTLFELAMAIGTNRYYLSLYFSRQGMNYNAYINGLRIQHFMNLYHQAVADQQSFTAQQLAIESGFHVYRTFSNAFKHQMGQTVTDWIKAAGKQEQSQACLDSAERKQTRPKGKARQG